MAGGVTAVGCACWWLQWLHGGLSLVACASALLGVLPADCLAAAVTDAPALAAAYAAQADAFCHANRYEIRFIIIRY